MSSSATSCSRRSVQLIYYLDAAPVSTWSRPRRAHHVAATPATPRSCRARIRSVGQSATRGIDRMPASSSGGRGVGAQRSSRARELRTPLHHPSTDRLAPSCDQLLIDHPFESGRQLVRRRRPCRLHPALIGARRSAFPLGVAKASSRGADCARRGGRSVEEPPLASHPALGQHSRVPLGCRLLGELLQAHYAAPPVGICDLRANTRATAAGGRLAASLATARQPGRVGLAVHLGRLCDRSVCRVRRASRFAASSRPRHDPPDGAPIPCPFPWQPETSRPYRASAGFAGAVRLVMRFCVSITIARPHEAQRARPPRMRLAPYRRSRPPRRSPARTSVRPRISFGSRLGAYRRQLDPLSTGRSLHGFSGRRHWRQAGDVCLLGPDGSGGPAPAV